MIQNGRGGGRAIGRKRKQFNNKVNPKKFKPNFRNNGGPGMGGQQRDQQRDFARDYIDFENFEDCMDSPQRSSSSYYPPPQRPMNMSMNMAPLMSHYPMSYRETRPLLPLPPAPPMYGQRRQPMPLTPLPHHMSMRRMGGGPPMPLLPPRPLLSRPLQSYAPERSFGPMRPPPRPMRQGPMRQGPMRQGPLRQGPMRQGIRPNLRGGAFLRGGGNRPGGGPVGVNNGVKRPVRGHNNKNNKTLTKKQKKKNGKNVPPTPPQELNDMTKPWITDEIREANTKKIDLNKIATKSADPQKWKAFWEAREKVKTMVQAARLEYIKAHPEEIFDCG